MCFVNNIQKATNRQISCTVSLAVSAAHPTGRFILEIWLYLSPVLIKPLVHLVFPVTEFIVLLVLIFKVSVAQEPFSRAPFVTVLQSRGTS